MVPLTKSFTWLFLPVIVNSTPKLPIFVSSSLSKVSASPRVCWKQISGFLESTGYRKADSHCVLYSRQRDGTYLLLYEDEVLIAAPSMASIEDVKKSLKTKWKWTDTGEVGYVLGLKMERDRRSRTIPLSRRHTKAHICTSLHIALLPRAILSIVCTSLRDHYIVRPTFAFRFST
jgi:hypothetical protein